MPPEAAPIYLDNQATTRCDPRVLAAMLPFFSEQFGNPHSAEHAMGQAAEAAVETARGQVATLLGADPRDLVPFEKYANAALSLVTPSSAARALAAGAPNIERVDRLVQTIAAAHGKHLDELDRTVALVDGLLESCADLAWSGFETVVLPVGADGLLDPALLEEALRVPTLLVSVMAVNNETGVIQNVAALGAMARAAGALFHCDAAQAAGKIAVSLRDTDLLSLSGHKM